MFTLLHLHIISFFIIVINYLILNKNTSDNLASKYFMINYIYHHHRKIGCFIIYYPFLIIMLYFLYANIIPIGTLFIAVLHVYFLFEIISRQDIDTKEQYISWYKEHVIHSFSMHAHDMLRKNFKFLDRKRNTLVLFKFELIFFLVLLLESEYMTEVLAVLDTIK